MQLTEADRDYVDLLFVRLRYGDPVHEAAARSELQAWCADDAERQRYVAELEMADSYLGALPPLPLPTQSEVVAPLPKPRSRRYLPWLAAAASVVAATFLGVVNPELSSVQYASAVGEQKTVTLTDGSQVVLNTTTTLRFSNRLRSREAILLKGEALFDIAHSEWRPFSVFSEQTQVRVVGTAFSVRNFEHGSRIEVARGRVEVKPSKLNQGRLLSAGQAVDTAGGAFGSDVLAIDISSISQWRDGRLTFRGTPLGEVLKELQRYRQGAIRLQDTKLAELQFSGSFSISEPDKVLALLPSMYSVKVSIDPDGTARILRR